MRSALDRLILETSPRSLFAPRSLRFKIFLEPKNKTAGSTWVVAGGVAASLLTSCYVWMILGVMKKISSWFEVLTVVCLNRLPR